MLTCAVAFGQDHNMCPVEDVNDLPPNAYSGSTDETLLEAYEPVVFNVHTWLLVEDNDITDPNNPNFPQVGQNEVLESVARLNHSFNKFNIFFKYNGFSVLNDTTLALQINDDNPHPACSIAAYPNFTSYIDARNYINSQSNNPNVVKPNSLNIYVMKEARCFGGMKISATAVSTNQVGMTQNNLTHEMGHLLRLLHTRQGSGSSACETVSRDANNPCDPTLPLQNQPPCFNADIKGDYIVDTAATPSLGANQFPNEYNTGSCEYTGEGEDCQDTPYQIFNEDIINVMGNAYACATNHMTTGQGIKMREYIETAITNSFPLADAEVDVSALYEPYSGSYYNSGPYLPEHTPLFQPGFTYSFLRCYGDYDQPSPYGDTSFSYTNGNILLSIDKYESDYSTITHPNRSAIYIAQLDGYVVNRPRCCYNNNNGFASDGRTVKFHDGVVNNNYTITERDSTAINDPHLINNLENGLYKIEKEYPDGTQTQTVIYKGEGNE